MQKSGLNIQVLHLFILHSFILQLFHLFLYSFWNIVGYQHHNYH